MEKIAAKNWIANENVAGSNDGCDEGAYDAGSDCKEQRYKM